MHANTGRNQAPRNEADRVSPWLGPLSGEAEYNPYFSPCRGTRGSSLSLSEPHPLHLKHGPGFVGSRCDPQTGFCYVIRNQRCWITGRDSTRSCKAWCLESGRPDLSFCSGILLLSLGFLIFKTGIVTLT